MAGDLRWYSVRCHFSCGASDIAAEETVYEERIVLVRACSSEEAIAKGEAEARTYAHENSSVSYLECADCYQLLDAELKDGTEVFSLMRDSALEEEEYIRRYFQTGKERTR